MKIQPDSQEQSSKLNNLPGEGPFKRLYDRNSRRVSYDVEIGDHCYQELSVVAGILDMLFLLFESDHINSSGDEIAFVIMDARDRADALRKIF